MPRSVLPPDLRDASAEERAELEQVWARLGDAPPPAPPGQNGSSIRTRMMTVPCTGCGQTSSIRSLPAPFFVPA